MKEGENNEVSKNKEKSEIINKQVVK